VLNGAHGVMMTSATCATGRGADEWDSAVARSGAAHLEVPPDGRRFRQPVRLRQSGRGFDRHRHAARRYPALAGAYGRLIEASGGGALGLFTAIRQLRAVHGRIADRMARNGLPLYAQHVDPIDTGTLVDIFRDDPHASLLGTDALRDGVDVPGDSLRLVIMEQVPWPKPSILHRARRLAHPQGGQAMTTASSAHDWHRLLAG
jgi:ATP-dependent DNA helicase DinG